MQAKRCCWWILLVNLRINAQTAQSENYPPRFKDTQKPQYVARLGDIKRLKCAVTGLPPPSIIWIKNNQPLHQSERIRKLNKNKTIKIKGVRLEDRGNYTCIAENPLGKVNLTFQLKVRHDENLTATDLLSATKRPTTEHQARDLTTNLKTTESRAPVFSDPDFLQRSFMAWPVSHSIRLKCQATGALPLKYEWLKDGRSVKRRRLEPYVNASLWYLKLRDIVPSDSGKYTCIVSNRYGSINHTFTLQVVARARSAPTLQTDLPKNKTAQVGDNVTFTCIVRVSGTLPDFRWLKWNKSITSMPKTYKDILNGSYRLIDPYYYETVQVQSKYGVEVTIVNVTEDDFGLYTCFVSNHIGKDFRSAYLIKYVKPTVPVTAPPSRNLHGSKCFSTPNGSYNGNTLPPGYDKKAHDAALVPGTVSACVLTIAVAVVIICCWRRRSRNRRHLSSRILIVSELEFEYDAFVIFSSQDLDWVNKTLIPTLEKKHGFKCSVRYGDFVLGIPYRENMVNSVYKSRKTVAVVSKNFFKSNYCGSEMEYALHQLMERRDDSIVVIELDDVDNSNLPKELRKRSYIDYPNNAEKNH